MKNKIPLGIWIISVIYYLSVILSLIIAGIFFLKPNLLTILPGFNLVLAPSIIYSIGSFMILFSILAIILATGLLKGKNWARTILIVVSSINLIGGIISITTKDYLSGLNAFFNSLVLIYILFNKKVKKHFEKIELPKITSDNSD